jgi:hypothetical protein
MRGRQDFGSRSARFAVDAVTRTDSIDELFGVRGSLSEGTPVCRSSVDGSVNTAIQTNWGF